MKRYFSWFSSILLAGFLLLGVNSVPIIDGKGSDWFAGNKIWQRATANPSVPASATITNVYTASDHDNLYWRLDTAANTDWGQIGNIAICMDTDGNPDNNESCGPCESDYILKIDPEAKQTAELWQNAGCQPLPTTPVKASAENNLIEFSLPLLDIGIQVNTCLPNCKVNAQVILSSGGTPDQTDLSGPMSSRVGFYVLLPIITK